MAKLKSAKKPKQIIKLYGVWYALLFPYFKVSDMTVALALPGKQWKKSTDTIEFVPESDGMEKTMRLDSIHIENRYSKQVEKAKELKLQLDKYILIRVGEETEVENN